MDLITFINSNGLTFKDTPRTITVYTANNRIELARQMANEIDNAIYYPTPVSTSSIGYLKIDDSKKVYIKPLIGNKTKHQYSINETMLTEAINRFGFTINVQLNAPDRTILIESVSLAELVGTDTTNGKKTDVKLYLENGSHFNVSLKMESAFCWQSADKMFSDTARPIIERAIEQGHIELSESEHAGIYKLSPRALIPATHDEMMEVVFGSDILNTGCIISKTFTEQSFSFDEATNTLHIDCARIIETAKDVDLNKDICFVIRNDRTRGDHIIPGKKGLRIIAQMDISKMSGVWLDRNE